MDVDVSRAKPEEKPVLANLFQLYVHDFSEHWTNRANDRNGGELGDDGLFPPYPWLDAYWGEAARIPLLVRANGRLAGFALINRRAHSGLEVDRNMAEFFIARKHRLNGLGRAAARTILQRYPGLWEAAVARRNTGALAFWRQAVSGCPGLTSLDELDRHTDEWDGPILRFRIAPESSGNPD